MTVVENSCARPFIILLLFPEIFPETSRIFPDCGFLMGLETDSETGKRNATETTVSPTWFLSWKMDTRAVREENVICNFPCATFLLPVNTWTGLGEYGVEET